MLVLVDKLQEYIEESWEADNRHEKKLGRKRWTKKLNKTDCKPDSNQKTLWIYVECK